MLDDLRYAWRQLLRSPGFTVVAVLTLSLGVGATTAIFTVVDAVLLRPLPYADPDRLVTVSTHVGAQDALPSQLSVLETEDYRGQAGTLTGVTAYAGTSINLTGGDQPERVLCMVVSPNFFDVLGVVPILGRTFRPEDDEGGIGYTSVISYGLWQRRFGGDPGVIGKSVRMDEDPTTIIGVLPESFEQPLDPGPTPTEVWSASNFHIPQLPFEDRQSRFLNVIARLAPGADLGRVRDEASRIAGNLQRIYPDVYPQDRSWGLVVEPLLTRVVGSARTTLLLLLGAAGVVLLIGCANVANLLLARATARQREIAIRTALGASRRRLLRQLLTESVLLGVLGGVAGGFVATWGVSLLLRLAPAQLPHLATIGIDARILAFTLGLSLLTGIGFGAIPALWSTGADLQATLKEGGKGHTGGRSRNRSRSTLVVIEVALALVLLIDAGLLLKSFQRLLSVDPGFDGAGVLTVRMALPVPNKPEEGTYFTPAARAEFFRRILDGARAIPGVEEVALTTQLPLRPAFVLTFEIEGRPAALTEPPPSASIRVVSPGYFRTLRIPLQQGREFLPTDQAETPRVVLINRAFARRYWPGEDPLGHRIRLWKNDAWATVVGVVADVAEDGLEHGSPPATYVSFLQRPSREMTLLVRGKGPLRALAEPLRTMVAGVDRDEPVYAIATMDEVLSGTVAQRRFSMVLLLLFGAEALILAGIGVFGVLASAVGQRRHEIGLRMALGAQPWSVIGLIVAQGLRLVLLGLGLGLAVSLGLTRVIAGLLFGVDGTDPMVYGGIGGLMLVVALLASFLPARRASRVDPMVALRSE